MGYRFAGLYDPRTSKYSFLVASGVLEVDGVPGTKFIYIPGDTIDGGYRFEESIPKLSRMNSRQPQGRLKNPGLVPASWMLVAQAIIPRVS